MRIFPVNTDRIGDLVVADGNEPVGARSKIIKRFLYRRADGNAIGEVEDVVLDSEAKVVGVTVDVGGFLGIGETTVLLPTDDLRLVQTPEDSGFYIVTRMSREQIEDAEEIENLLGDD